MQVLCDLQPLFSLFKCQTPGHFAINSQTGELIKENLAY